MGHLARLCAGVRNTYHTAGTFGPGHTTRPTAANPTRSIWTWDTTRAAANDFNAYYTTGSLLQVYADWHAADSWRLVAGVSSESGS
jgi:hypothetical protein